MNLEHVKELRSRTGCNLLQAKKALDEAGGDLVRAEELVRERMTAPARPAGNAGGVFAYVHHDRRLGALVMLRCATDFVARTEEFQHLGNEVAKQVATMQPADVGELLAQKYIRDAGRTIGQLVGELSARTGEPIEVDDFARLELPAAFKGL
jgi:elongation factor Ts